MKRLTISGHACTETLALLITIAWADGRLEETEKAGVRGAAEVFNLTKELRARLDTLLEEPLPVDQLLLDTLSTKDRAFAYVAATWLTGVDDNVDPKEQAILDQVGNSLEFSKERLAELASIARELKPADKKARNWAHEIETLFRSIAPRLEGPGEEVELNFE